MTWTASNIPWAILLGAGIAQAAFILLFLYTRPTKNKLAKIYLGFLLMIAFLSALDNLFYTSVYFLKFWSISSFSRGSILLIGPLLWLYTRTLFKRKIKFSKKTLLHFIPYFLLFIITVFQLFTMSFEEKQSYILSFMEGEGLLNWVDFGVLYFYSLHFTMYCGKIILMLYREAKKEKEGFLLSNDQCRKWIYRLIYYFSIVPLLLLLSIIHFSIIGKGSYLINFYYTLILIGFIYYLSYMYFTNPNLVLLGFKKKPTSFNNYLNTGLGSTLLSLMKERKLYLDPHLRLAHLAELLNVSIHQVSHVINNDFGKNFFEFVNSFRIEAFKQMLHQQMYNDYSLLGLAYEAGFNSKSSFNKAFKKETGMTPSEYKIQVAAKRRLPL